MTPPSPYDGDTSPSRIPRRGGKSIQAGLLPPRQEKTNGRKPVDEAADMGDPGDLLAGRARRAPEDAEEDVGGDPDPGDRHQPGQPAPITPHHPPAPPHPP